LGRLVALSGREQASLHTADARTDVGNKIAASAHGMGSGGSAVDAMVIGCLGVDRRAERSFSYLAIFALLPSQERHRPVVKRSKIMFSLSRCFLPYPRCFLFK